MSLLSPPCPVPSWRPGGSDACLCEFVLYFLPPFVAPDLPGVPELLTGALSKFGICSAAHIEENPGLLDGLWQPGCPPAQEFLARDPDVGAEGPDPRLDPQPHGRHYLPLGPG